MVKEVKTKEQEKTSIKGTGLCGFGANTNVAAIDVKNGKIVRIRPLHYDWRYKPEEFRPWKLEARGKVFEAPLKTMLPPHAFGYKKRIYSPTRASVCGSKKSALDMSTISFICSPGAFTAFGGTRHVTSFPLILMNTSVSGPVGSRTSTILSIAWI